MCTRWLLAPLLLLAACGGGDDDDDTSPGGGASSACGDGYVEGSEDCDDGAANSDTVADACRNDCTPARCGDGVVDTGEACDDGATWGADGCSAACQREEGEAEAEPNDTPAQAQALPAARQIHGAVQHERDVDCFRFEVGTDDWLSVRLLPSGDACPEYAALRLYDDAGTRIASGYPRADGCAWIDPAVTPGARFLANGGQYVVCLEGLSHTVVHGYTLAVDSGTDSCALPGLVTAPWEDLDADLTADFCDDDDDADGFADAGDTCPRMVNDGSTQLFVDPGDGFIHDWLVAGPFVGTPAAEGCRPPGNRLGEDDGTAVPALGETAAGRPWRAVLSSPDYVDVQSYLGGDAPRDGYLATWVRTDAPRSLQLALGVDDGGLAWVNEALVGEISSCQGANADQFRFPVELHAGWNRVMLRVYDGAGSWGVYARFLTPEGGFVLDLPVTLGEPGFAIDQRDADGDGLGDVCDPDPAHP